MVFRVPIKGWQECAGMGALGSMPQASDGVNTMSSSAGTDLNYIFVVQPPSEVESTRLCQDFLFWRALTLHQTRAEFQVTGVPKNVS